MYDPKYEPGALWLVADGQSLAACHRGRETVGSTEPGAPTPVLGRGLPPHGSVPTRAVAPRTARTHLSQLTGVYAQV